MSPLPQTATRYLVWAGSAVLAATAAFHTTGWADVAAAADKATLSPFLSAAVKSLWIYASYHWFFIAVLATVAVVHPSQLARIVLGLSALVLTADTIMLLVAVGPFIGEALLAVSIACYAAGAVLLSPNR